MTLSDGEHRELIKEIHNIALQLAVIKQKQEDNHNDNKNDIRTLFDKVALLDHLPCSVHADRFHAYEKHVKEGSEWRRMVIGLFFTVLISIIGFASAWGTMNNRVDDNTKRLDKQDKIIEKLEHQTEI